MHCKESMSSIERVMSVASLQEPDRIPVMADVIGWQAKQAGIKFSECIKDVNKYVTATVGAQRKYEYDMVEDIGGIPMIAEALGAKIFIPEDDPPALAEPILRNYTYQDLDKLCSVNVLKDGRIPSLLHVISKLKKKVGPDIPVVAWLSPPFREACILRRAENLYRDIIRNPAFVKKLLDFLVQPCIDYGRACIEAGADLILTGSPHASSQVISRKHYKEFVHPIMKELLTELREAGTKIILHICGDWSDRLDLVTDEGAHILHFDHPAMPNVDLAEFKENFGSKVALLGSVHVVETMLRGTPDEVYQESRMYIQKLGQGGGFALGGNCVIPRDTSARNVRALVRAAREHGCYPLSLDPEAMRYRPTWQVCS